MTLQRGALVPSSCFVNIRLDSMASGVRIAKPGLRKGISPVRDGVNRLTVDFFAPKALANRIELALEQTEEMQALRNSARRTAVKYYDLKRVLLPRWIALFDDLINGRRPSCFEEASAPKRP